MMCIASYICSRQKVIFYLCLAVVLTKGGYYGILMRFFVGLRLASGVWDRWWRFRHWMQLDIVNDQQWAPSSLLVSLLPWYLFIFLLVGDEAWVCVATRWCFFSFAWCFSPDNLFCFYFLTLLLYCSVLLGWQRVSEFFSSCCSLLLQLLVVLFCFYSFNEGSCFRVCGLKT